MPREKLSLKEIESRLNGELGCTSYENYQGVHTSLQWECIHGHIFTETVQNVLLRVRKCPHCQAPRNGEKFLIRNNEKKKAVQKQKFDEFALKNGGNCLTEQIYSRKTYATWQCRHGHEWQQTLEAMTKHKDREWCPTCRKISLSYKGPNSNLTTLERIVLTETFYVLCNEGYTRKSIASAIGQSEEVIELSTKRYKLSQLAGVLSKTELTSIESEVAELKINAKATLEKSPSASEMDNFVSETHHRGKYKDSFSFEGEIKKRYKSEKLKVCVYILLGDSSHDNGISYTDIESVMNISKSMIKKWIAVTSKKVNLGHIKITDADRDLSNDLKSFVLKRI